MSVFFWLFLAVWFYCPYLHLELGAQHSAGKYRWTYPRWFTVILFIAWPVLIPASISLMRRNYKRGLNK